MTTDIPNFDSVSRSLEALGALGNTSEIHGLLTALFCGSAKIRLDGWLASLMSQKFESTDTTAADAKASLQKLFENTEHSLSDEDFTFHMLVPDESENFENRIEHFAYWCQGFIAGLNLIGVQLKDQPTSEVQEAIDDLIKFSCLRYDEEESGDEENEQAYTELLEYARVAVMLLFAERKNIIGTHFEVDGNNTVH